MPVPIQLPEIGAGDQTIRVSTWFVTIGDTVLEGDRLVEVAIPGATFDVSAPCAGEVVSIATQEGTVITAGEMLGTIEEG